MHSLVRTVFGRLHDLDPVAEEEKLAAQADEATEGDVKMTVNTAAAVPPVETEYLGPSESDVDATQSTENLSLAEEKHPLTASDTKATDVPSEEAPQATPSSALPHSECMCLCLLPLGVRSLTFYRRASFNTGIATRTHQCTGSYGADPH
jgi:golgi-specific brefeldin A-resistance guanine nucleotide exchange factor 1